MDVDSSPTNNDLTTSLENVLDQLRALVSEEPTDADPTLIQIRSAALFARLKNLTRSANAAPRSLRQATMEVRQEADQAFLSMQELLYEKRHLEREIEKCKAFGYGL
jgi:THO complex subunit 5